LGTQPGAGDVLISLVVGLFGSSDTEDLREELPPRRLRNPDMISRLYGSVLTVSSVITSEVYE